MDKDFDKIEEERPDDDNRELTDFEQECLKKFEENDAEIDGLLGGIIDQVDRIKFHAENISTEIETQA